MALIAVDKDGTENISNMLFRRDINDRWVAFSHSSENEPLKQIFNKRRVVELPKGSIEKLIGKKLTWEDEPVELKEKS